MAEYYSDIHIHCLYGVDDGAKTEDMMHAMVDAAYNDGTRLLCVTPHYHPGYFGHNHDATQRAFIELSFYAASKYKDLVLARANEIRYAPDCISWIESGEAKTVNGTNYVLFDFNEGEVPETIYKGTLKFLNRGYRPILAHPERYYKVKGIDLFESLHRDGVLLQLDTMSVLGDFGRVCKKQCKKMLSAGIVEMVSTDAHNVSSRPPIMSECADYISKHYDADYARKLCRTNAMRFFGVK